MANESTEEDADVMVRSKQLYISCVLTGDLDDVQKAVRYAQEICDLTPPDDPQMPFIRYNLARPLVRRFLHTRQEEDLTKAIKLFELANQMLTDHSPVYQTCFKYLMFTSLVRQLDLEGSMEQDDLHVNIPSVPRAKVKIDALSRMLGEDEEVFEYYDRMADSPIPPRPSLQYLNSEIQLNQQALKFFSPCPFDPAKISIILFRLGVSFSLRYRLRNLREDNDAQIACFTNALKLPMTIDKLVMFSELATDSLIERFHALGKSEDLDNAVNYAERAADNFEPGAAGFASCLDTLARALVCRFEVTGDMNNLDAAIRSSLRAVAIAEGDTSEPGLPRLLVNLAEYLRHRFLKTGQSADLTHAVEIAQKAVDLCHPEDPGKVECLVHLSELETSLGDTLQELKYVQDGVRHLKEAWAISTHELQDLDIGPKFHLFVSMSRLLYQMRDWDGAIKITRTLCDYPDFALHPQAGGCHLNLCDCLFNRWKDTHKREDIDEAITRARRLVELWASNANQSTVAHETLAKCLYHRYKSKGGNEDLKEALAVVMKGFRTSSSVPIYRIIAGQMAIDILCELADWDHARTLSQEIVDLIVILNTRSSEWKDKQYWLQLFSHQVPIYASIALQAKSDVFDVIDLLETCRGSILGHLVDSKMDLDDLMRVAPKEAERFSTLRDEVNAVVNPSGPMNARVGEITRRSEAEADLRVCLEEIRKREGFHRFLLGPAQSELKVAAAQGPIVIVNVTPIRSDAIIITKDASHILPLPDLKHDTVTKYQEAGPINFGDLKGLGKKNKKYLELLRWLWENCVKLILKKLNVLIPTTKKFHVWWIGTGIASSFPFHAAGIYNGAVRETVQSQAISSYTPTLKILLHGRRKLRINHLEPGAQRSLSKPEMLIVSMPSTPGMADLKGVRDEAEKLQQIVQGVYSAQHSLQPSSSDTMERMEKCEIVHFACHGQSIKIDPSRSHLLLQTVIPGSTAPIVDELKVRDVAALNLKHGKLAFLSACSTAENTVSTLWDEVLHLASGFHVAGYLHTVGNLWPADDDVSVQVVEGFYKHLLEAGELGDGQNVAKALNKALLDVMEEKSKQPLSWAPFVHFGV